MLDPMANRRPIYTHSLTCVQPSIRYPCVRPLENVTEFSLVSSGSSRDHARRDLGAMRSAWELYRVTLGQRASRATDIGLLREISLQRSRHHGRDMHCFAVYGVQERQIHELLLSDVFRKSRCQLLSQSLASFRMSHSPPAHESPSVGCASQ